MQRVAMIVRMQPDTDHFVYLVNSPQVFLPIGNLRVDRAERYEKTAMLATICRQSSVNPAHITMEQGIEAASPRFGHASLPKPGDESGRVVSGKPAKRPA